MTRDLFEEIGLALSSHLNRDYDSLDRDEVVREVLTAIRGADAEEIDAALASHPAPPSLSYEEANDLLKQRLANFRRRAVKG